MTADVFAQSQPTIFAPEDVQATTAQLQLGELALNTTDGKLYFKKNVSGTESIVAVSASTASQGENTLMWTQ